MRSALARLKLSIMINSSIRFSFTGGQVGWTRNTSRPRTSSSILQEISPSGKFLIVIRPGDKRRYSHIFVARFGFARPLKSVRSFIMEKSRQNALVSATASPPASTNNLDRKQGRLPEGAAAFLGNPAPLLVGYYW